MCLGRPRLSDVAANANPLSPYADWRSLGAGSHVVVFQQI